MKKLLALAFLILVATSALAQKGPIDELGFHPEKQYDFSGVDSVNLFNGNLVVSIPVGPRYSVSSNLSYQFTLVFNGKIWDSETWCEDPFNTGCVGLNLKARTYPNLGSNAGNGWRVSLGRLLPPVATGRQNDSLDDDTWVYEGPAGDEHNVSEPNPHDGMRMRVVPDTDDTAREIEFGSGEIHRFELENAVWRLKQMRDRFNNAVNIAYTYSADGKRELSWTITDTTSRSHTVTLDNYPGMADGWSRGQMVSTIALQGFGGATATYSLAYSPDTWPALTALAQPDGTQYNFTGSVSQIRYPTGGTVSYTYVDYAFAPQDSICALASSNGVATRTVSDGSTTHVWDYKEQMGFRVPVTPDQTPTCIEDGSLNGPVYWTRTSVVAPLDANSHRARTDHYFSTFADAPAYGMGFTVNNPLPGQGLQAYSHPGAIGVPPSGHRPMLAPGVVNGDVDSRDENTSSARLLSTEVYANCDSVGDCTNGSLLRSTYERYFGSVIPKPQGGHSSDDTRLLSSRTVFNDDAGCGSGGTVSCYTQITNGDDNGAMQFRTTTLESNFPGAQPVTTTTSFPAWTASDLTNPSKPWLLNIYTDKTRTENGAQAREQFCFDGTSGVLGRHRVLASPGPSANDILHVFDRDSHGDVQFVSDFGGDIQAIIDQGAVLCSIPLPSARPWYKVENSYISNSHYTGGVAAWSRYYDRTNGLPLNFLSVDRDIDYSTGVVTAARDTSGLQTSYGYTALPARLESVTASNGAITNYTYTSASGTVGGTWTPAKVQAVTTSGSQSVSALYFFDGLGRNMRTANLGPQNAWFAAETSFDEAGRVAWKSAPESTGSSAPTGSLVAAHKTQYTYDAFGRPITITPPDAKATSFFYSGVRKRTSTAAIALGTGESPVTRTEKYDHNGRLITVTEAAGLPNEVTTSYGYDVGGHLTSVNSTASSQSRTFTYPDRRGFLQYEYHPELGASGNGSVHYRDYDPHGLPARRTTGDENGPRDLVFSYDSAGRVTDVYDHGLFPRLLKHFVFDNSASASDYRRGKLTEATRYNHPTTGDVAVTESYSYTNLFGRPSKRDTVVKTPAGTILQSFSQNFTYDPFSALGQIDYPACLNNITCGGSPTGAVLYGRNHGFLTGVTNYASSITYNPDASILAVTHSTAAPVTDTYSQDTNGMSRPGLIKFEGLQSCTAYSATVGGGGTITAGSGQTAAITATFSGGTAPWSITWSDGITQSGITQNPITRLVSPSATTTYTLTSATDAMGCPASRTGTASVTVQSCNASATVSGGGNITIGQSAQIQAAFTGTSPWNITWSDGQTQSGITQSPWTRTVTPATSTTYTITSVTDGNGCSGARSGSATVNVASLPAPSWLVATTVTGSSLNVSVAWNSVQGATWYQIERATRINPADWQNFGGHVTGSSISYSFTENPNPVTYLYRVRSGITMGGTDYPSAPSVLDYATVATILFTDDPLQGGVTRIKGVHLGELRHAIDAARYAAGLTAAWSSYASATGPITASDNIIARQKLDEAVNILLLHGVAYSGETPALNGKIWAYQYQQIREGVK